jgi:uncharacterized membrane protein YccF (DUF307 family)
MVNDKPYLIVILSLAGIILALAIWLIYLIHASTINNVPVRAISAAEHAACATLPRGSQEMEDRRYDCFKTLYTPPWTRTD